MRRVFRMVMVAQKSEMYPYAGAVSRGRLYQRHLRGGHGEDLQDVGEQEEEDDQLENTEVIIHYKLSPNLI